MRYVVLAKCAYGKRKNPRRSCVVGNEPSSSLAAVNCLQMRRQWPSVPMSDEVEVHEKYLLARAVFRCLEQIDRAGEAGRSGQVRGDVLKSDWQDAVNHDMSIVELVASAFFHSRALPDAYTRCDRAAFDRFSQAFCEEPRSSLACPSERHCRGLPGYLRGPRAPLAKAHALRVIFCPLAHWWPVCPVVALHSEHTPDWTAPTDAWRCGSTKTHRWLPPHK